MTRLPDNCREAGASRLNCFTARQTASGASKKGGRKSEAAGTYKGSREQIELLALELERRSRGVAPG